MPEVTQADLLRLIFELGEGQKHLQEDQQLTQLSLQRLSEEMRAFKDEMRAFKDEMLAFKDEMLSFKDEMLSFKDEMLSFKDEMLAFKEEMRAFKEEMRSFKEEMKTFKDGVEVFQGGLEDFKEENRLYRERSEKEIKSLNRAWGNLANKLGTILEDITAPNIERFANEEFGFESVQDLLVRVRKTSSVGAERQTEFDVICTGPGKVIYAEMKSTPDLVSLTEMKSKLGEFFDFFPEYRSRELVGVYASWSLDKRMRLAISAAGLYGVAMGDDTMEIVARPEPTPHDPMS